LANSENPMIRYLFMVLLLSLAARGMVAQSESQPAEISKDFANPVFEGADPWLFQKDGYYYYCFVADNGISISRSRYITKRGETKKVWEAPDSGWNRACIWAPELHFINGYWYVYYAAGESGPPYIHQKTGVLQSVTDDPFSNYTDMGMVYTGNDQDMKSNNMWAIDMTVFIHRGRLFAAWSGWENQALTDKTSQHLYVAEMENPYTMKTPRVKISSPEEKWETGGPLDLQEGPEILIKGENLFIVYSCRESWTIDYRLGILKLNSNDADPLLPSSWVKTGPVFSGPFGTGHCSFVKSPDGREDWIVYHSKKSVKEGWQRDVRTQRFGWDSKGYPVFGQAVMAGEILKRPSGEYRLEKKLRKTGLDL